MQLTKQKDTTMETINNSRLPFTTRMQKAVRKNKSLTAIIEEFSMIDYEYEVYGDIITDLRAKIDNATSLEEKRKFKDQLEKYHVKSVRKYVLLVEKLLKLSQEKDNEIGVSQGTTYQFNGSFWQVVEKPMVHNLLSSIAIKSGIDPIDAKQQDEVEKMYKQFAGTAIIPEVDEASDTVKINLRNGTFVIEKEASGLRVPKSCDFLKYKLPFDYNPEAKAPMFDAFLDRVLPDRKSQMVLAEYLGYILNKNLKLEKCLLLLGNGANGKSVFFDIVNALLGPSNVCHYSLQNLCDDKGYYRAMIGGKLLNYSSEIGARRCPPDTVKKLISGEPIDARLPFGEAFEVSNYCRFMFNANALPRETEQTEAYYRRFLIVKFGVTIPKEERDPFLAKKIIENELSGIFNWILEGLDRITQQQGFTHAPLIAAELTAYEEESNSVGLFMSEHNYRPSADKSTQRKHLYEPYQNFCRENGFMPVGSPEFSRRLENLGYKIKRKATNNATLVYCDNSALDEHTVSVIQDLLGS